MSGISSVFIRRPVATTLLTLGVVLLGLAAMRMLPVSSLPQVDFPTILISASLPGASPETMAATVATPLERALGRIAGISEMTSQSTLGSTSITLQFDLDRDIDGAARDVQAALNAARSLLPTGLPSNPTYRKMNPSEAPVLILSLTSDSLPTGKVYDAASTVLAQRLAQVLGVGQVKVGGGSLPAVRVDLNPDALHHAGIGLEAVRTAIVNTNVLKPKGELQDQDARWQVEANDQATRAADYLPLVVSYSDGGAVRLRDVATVTDSVENSRIVGLSNGKPGIVLLVFRQSGANVVATVDRIKAMLPTLKASLPAGIDVNVMMDRTTTIRASLREVGRTMLASIALVILVVFLFLRNGRATLIPSVAVPVSLVGTFAVMYLCGYSIDNLSLMAMTIATGFVVDDAVVVLENIARHVESGTTPLRAALIGAREVSFTVVSMSLSLVAVFIPILFMGGIIGRLFREFAVTLSAAILVSLVVSLTTTPMMCAHLLPRETDDREEAELEAEGRRPGAFFRLSAWAAGLGGRFYDALISFYARSLAAVLRHERLALLFLGLTVAANIYLYVVVPKGFFPQQDTGQMMGALLADQDISFTAMRKKLTRFVDVVMHDPAVKSVDAFTGGGRDSTNTATVIVGLKPLSEGRAGVDQVMARLRAELARESGARLYLMAAQDIHIGGRSSRTQFQYTLVGDDLTTLRLWGDRLLAALRALPQLADVNSDQQDRGLQTSLFVDHDGASRLGLTQKGINAALNDAFGQRQVTTIFNPANQYKVVLEYAPAYTQGPEDLSHVRVAASDGSLVPLASVASVRPTLSPLAVNHQGHFAATTISFNLAQGATLSSATAAVNDAVRRLAMPTSVHGSFAGSAEAFKASLRSEPLLVLAALVALYIVLGVLYESLIHPLTILSTLPSAGLGALLALMACDTEFSVIALIGVLLLAGIVKKNAIMMIDFAIDAERRQNMRPREAIFNACLLRFRPIMMTTLAALLGAVPLAMARGDGSELLRPLGISIVGGLAVSQVLTLYTTPVVYLHLDRFRLRCRALRQRLWPFCAPRTGESKESA
ncbi:acriflavin resistance protein [Desulfovibrio sp. X2]|uniref:efflux RND transporter permease subunit n=1 Tax=Desulfovibrio sp. X2 TaxID=941449 RepID=UPI0003589BC2|nr:efflux RND transporter permease subunit [Desulfovibrio sp. X2]EPR37643.1 acriflavin resistance protein [Desulfovibrio sp. X2]